MARSPRSGRPRESGRPPDSARPREYPPPAFDPPAPEERSPKRPSWRGPPGRVSRRGRSPPRGDEGRSSRSPLRSRQPELEPRWESRLRSLWSEPAGRCGRSERTSAAPPGRSSRGNLPGRSGRPARSGRLSRRGASAPGRPEPYRRSLPREELPPEGPRCEELRSLRPPDPERSGRSRRSLAPGRDDASRRLRSLPDVSSPARSGRFSLSPLSSC